MTVCSEVETIPVPMPDGAVLPLYRRGGGKKTRLLFGHANGLAAGSYAPWLERLARDVTVYAFDARGHGGSRWPEGPLERVFSVERMADDLACIAARAAAAEPGAPLAYVGHSLGGASALKLAADGRAAGFTRLVIFEPPIFPPRGTPMSDDALARQSRLVAGTLKRRPHWPSPESFAERLKASPMFCRFEPAMLAAHARATLKPAPEGGYVLCCPPEVESFIFASHAATDTWSQLHRVGATVDLVGGDPDVPGNDWISAALPAMASILRARLTQLPRAGHLLIGEQPELCARLVLERIGS